MSFSNIKLFQESLAWPSTDAIAKKYYSVSSHFYFPEEITDLCQNKRTVLQAGGHAGLYARKYSKLFHTVYTFEPEQTNYRCLEINLQGIKNVRYFNKCIGEENKLVSLDLNKHNTGNHSINIDPDGHSSIECVTIDSLDILDLDLIHLDLEGYEYYALQGAKETIQRYKPLIVVEKNKMIRKFNLKFKHIVRLMESLGYSETARWKSDVAFRHQSQSSVF